MTLIWNQSKYLEITKKPLCNFIKHLFYVCFQNTYMHFILKSMPFIIKRIIEKRNITLILLVFL